MQPLGLSQLPQGTDLQDVFKIIHVTTSVAQICVPGGLKEMKPVPINPATDLLLQLQLHAICCNFFIFYKLGSVKLNLTAEKPQRGFSGSESPKNCSKN